jgi:CBS domain-containing protein
MSHKVKDWMSSPVIVVDQDSSASYALTLMRRRNIKSLLILMDPILNLYGIVTTTDIRNKIIAQDKNPANVPVREIMSENLVSAKPDWTLTQCSIEMQKNNINHMPVIDDNGCLAGLISATDLFWAAEEIGWEEI